MDLNRTAAQSREQEAYRGVNLFLLSASKYVSPFWLTMRQANELGGHVRKGEESTAVVLGNFPPIDTTMNQLLKWSRQAGVFFLACALVGIVPHWLGNQSQPFRCSFRFDHGLGTKGNTGLHGRKCPFGRSLWLPEEIGESGFVSRNGFGLKERSVPSTANDYEADSFKWIRACGDGFCDISTDHCYHHGGFNFLFRKNNEPTKIPFWFIFPKSMLVAVFRLAKQASVPVVIVIKRDHISPPPNVNCDRAAAVLKSLFQFKNGATIFQEGQRLIYVAEGEYPRSLRQLKFSLRCFGLGRSNVGLFTSLVYQSLGFRHGVLHGSHLLVREVSVGSSSNESANSGNGQNDIQCKFRFWVVLCGLVALVSGVGGIAIIYNYIERLSFATSLPLLLLSCAIYGSGLFVTFVYFGIW